MIVVISAQCFVVMLLFVVLFVLQVVNVLGVCAVVETIAEQAVGVVVVVEEKLVLG